MKKKEKEIEALEVILKDAEKRLKALKEKPEFESGKWYTPHNKYSGIAVFFLKEDGTKYGVNYTGDWVDNYQATMHDDNHREATKEEIKQALTSEARKRGFKKGVKYASIGGKNFTFNDDFYWNEMDHSLNDWQGDIFKDGEWAEIIKGVEINGHTMEQDGDIISFGCAKFHTEQLMDMHTLTGAYFSAKGDPNRTVTKFTLDSGVEISVEQLKLIVDEIK